MANYLISITNYLWTQSWQIAILTVIIAIMSILLKNKSAHIRYLLWLILLVKCLVPPLLTVPLAILPQEQITQPIIESAAKIPSVFIDTAKTTIAEPAITLPTSSAEPTIFDKLSMVTLRQWLGFAWILGAGLFVFVALIKALRVNRWLRRQREPLVADLQKSIRGLFTELKDTKFPKVWLVDGIGQPFVWGLFRGSIYLPKDFTEIKVEEHRRGIVSHELSHVIRFDAGVNLLQIIAQTIFWFHPLVWWANKKIRAEREKCCDEMAIAWLGTKARDFSNAIVNILTAEHKSTQPSPSLAVAGPVKNIEDRIKTIMNPSKKFYKHPSILAAITILLLALIAVPTTLALATKPAEKADVMMESGKRTLNFPNTFSVGTVYIRDAMPGNWYEGWEEAGEAKGRISVPIDQQVKLVISESAASDLSFLNDLGATDIQMLSFGWKAVTLGSLAPIGNLKSLKALNLQSTRFEYEDLKYLTKLDELDTLRLGDYKLSNESMRYIGDLTSLHSLALWGTGIDEEGLAYLQNLRNLTFLALNSCDITDSGLSYLKNMVDLEGLQLTKTRITDNGLSSLSHLTKLKSLLIGHNNITDAGLEKLRSFTLLENLWINNTLITDDGLAYLSDIKNLKELYASNTKISNAGLVHLKGLNDLWHLSITNIGNEGIAHLSELPSLKKLQIHDAQVTKASIPYFQKMQSIEEVLLSGDKINDTLLEAFRAALPTCKIWDPQRSRDYPMPTWRKKFEEVYRLENGQILKRIAPPFIPERRDYYVNEHSYQASAIPQGPAIMNFSWDGKLKGEGMGFGGVRDLTEPLDLFGLQSYEYEGPEELLSLKLPGDWIVRTNTTIEERMAALEQLLAEEIDRKISFEKRMVERKVIVASGEFEFHPLSGTHKDTWLHIYSDELDPDERAGGGTAQTITDLLTTLGNQVGIPVIDETNANKEISMPFGHHRSSYLRKVKDEAEKRRKLEMLLENLTKQTELQFAIEHRPVEVWFVTEQKEDK